MLKSHKLERHKLEGYQQAFIEFAIDQKVLQFGDFELKSGRKSPYFFNAGGFNSGRSLLKLGEFYAEALLNSGTEFDLLFGPAYKGIPLVSATSIALAAQYGRDVPYVFNRKEAKTHGEGGNLVGAELKGRLVIIDDVITAGTAIREVMALMKGTQALPVAVLVAIDRQERGKDQLSAIQEVEKDYGISVISIVKLSDITSFLRIKEGMDKELASIERYQQAYGVG
ncbi:MAG: orotate phosphoribosyltransferase [Flavobacterium sp.]|jgi:orotate phosphoribosyltransferase